MKNSKEVFDNAGCYDDDIFIDNNKTDLKLVKKNC